MAPAATAVSTAEEPLLRAEDLWFSYGAEPVLRGAGVSVRAGEAVALVGASGSGKSTLLYCLAGVLVPEHGTVRLAGQDVSSMSDRDRTRFRAAHCGFVLQFGRLVGDLTAAENVSMPLRLLGVSRRAAERAAIDALGEVGIADLATRRAATLSGGEQQRAAVARALIHEPAVVFADEPTGALDSHNSRLVMSCLFETAHAKGSAVLLVSHDDAVADAADRSVGFADGRALDPGARV